jgi:O-antigen ligase
MSDEFEKGSWFMVHYDILKTYKLQALIFLLIWIVSMILSAEFLISVSMIGLLVLAFFQLKINGPQVKITIRDTLKENFQKFKSEKVWWVVSIPFLLVLISGTWSSDWDYLLERLRIKLPFLILPFAFLSIPKLTKKEVYVVFYFLVLTMFVASLWSLGQYFGNFEAVNDQLSRGIPFPTPSNHIRFSLTLVLSILAGGTLFYEKFYISNPSERWFIGGMTIILFVFLHVISVRSGLASFYFAFFCLTLFFILKTRRYFVGLALILGLASIPFLAYQMLPSLKNKIDYALWDFKQYQKGLGKDYSDSERITSLEIGVSIGNEHPVFGIGAGDLKKRMYQIYANKYGGKFSKRMPHSQFVTLYAGVGIVGLLIFLFAFFYPLFYQENWKNPLFSALHAIIFLSFFMENTIENNYGISLFLLFLLIGLNYFRKSEDQIQSAT